MNRSPIATVLGRLEAAGKAPRKSGNGWSSCCPAHEDKSPSLSIAAGDDGRVLLRCHRGCALDDIAAALDLRVKDLFPAQEAPGLPAREIVYAIRDAEGIVVAEHVRREFADGSKDFLWRRDGRWGLGGLKVADLPLYGAERLAALRASVKPGERAKLVVTEGEKARDALHAKGLAAVATVTGAKGTPSDETLKVLLGFDVLLWPDNDNEGRDHMQRIGARLEALCQPPKYIHWSDAPPKGDAYNYFEKGGTAEQIHELAVDRLPEVDSVNCVDSVGGDTWENVVPFRLDLPDLPDFPVAALPKAVAAYCMALARQAQVAVEMVIACVLAAISLAVCGRFVVRPWPGYEEPTNIYTAPTAPSGSRKSTVIEQAVRPLYKIEGQLQKEAEPRIAAALSARRVAKLSLAEAEKKAAKRPNDRALREEAARLAAIHDAISVLTLPRLVTSNATSEAIVKLLAENGGRILVASGEGAEIIAIAGGLYTKGLDNYDVFLKGHAGDAIVVDRKTSDTLRVPRPALAMVLMFQPSVLNDLATHRTFRSRGFLGRMLFMFSKPNVGWRKARGEPMPDHVKQAYADMLGNLLRLPTERESLEGDTDEPTGPLVPKVVVFSSGGACALEEFFDEVEAAQRDGGELEGMRDWASKAHGHVARIAGILHMAEHHADASPWELEVAKSTVENAVAIGRVLLAHAKAAFALMGETPDIARAIRLVRHFAESQVESTTRRELHRALPGVFETADELDRPLQILCERGYVRMETPSREPGAAGRNASPRVLVNPLWLRQNRQNRQNPPQEVPEADSVNSVNSVMGSTGEDSPPPIHVPESPQSDLPPREPGDDTDFEQGTVRF